MPNHANGAKNISEDSKALAELIYDIYKEKKLKENAKIIKDQNNAKLNSRN